MTKTFKFDFGQLSLEDQKYLFDYFQVDSLLSDQLKDATSTEALKACYDEEDYDMVLRLSYFAALLAHGVAKLVKVPAAEGDKSFFVFVNFNDEVDFEFDIEWYDGLNSHGKGAISLEDTVDTFGLLDLAGLFGKYKVFS
jgi:hypothetical protein